MYVTNNSLITAFLNQRVAKEILRSPNQNQPQLYPRMSLFVFLINDFYWTKSALCVLSDLVF